MRAINLLACATLFASMCSNAQAPEVKWHTIAPDLFARSYTSNGLRHTEFRALSPIGTRAYAKLLQVHYPKLANKILAAIPAARLHRITDDSSDCTDLFSASGTSSGYNFYFDVRCPTSEGEIHGEVSMEDVPANLSGHYSESAVGALLFSDRKIQTNPQKIFKGDSGSWSATEFWTTDGGQSGGQCLTGITGDGDQPC